MAGEGAELLARSERPLRNALLEQLCNRSLTTRAVGIEDTSSLPKLAEAGKAGLRIGDGPCGDPAGYDGWFAEMCILRAAPPRIRRRVGQ